jgi:protocatechuate 3,4-dioxygenase beta subunit
MPYETEAELTPAVVKAMMGVSDAAIGNKLATLVTGLHDLIRTNRPSEAEFHFALDFIAAVGRACDDKHNEVVLLADVLGLTTLVMLINGEGKPGEEDGALLGPFYRENSPVLENGSSILQCATDGDAIVFEGQVLDPHAKPIEDVMVVVWQSSPNGLYENQDPTQVDMNLRGRFTTDAAGRFCFRSVRPAGYPVPTHGPTGDLLRAVGRSPYRPAHIHILLYKAGYETLITQRFYDDENAIENDAVFGARRSLVGALEKQPDGVLRTVSSFTMRPGEAHWPKPPIA